MKVPITIDVDEKDVVVFLDELNKDDGMRNRAADALLLQAAPSWVSNKTAVIKVLGAFSRAFQATAEERRLLNKKRRDRELYRLAFPK